MNRNRAVTSTAITKAVSSATAGDLQIATETLLTAIAIIKQSRVYEDECCQALVTSLKDCLVSIQGNYVDRYVHGAWPILIEKLKFRVKLASAMAACWYKLPTWPHSQQEQQSVTVRRKESRQRARTRPASGQRRSLRLGKCRNITKTQRTLLERRQGQGLAKVTGQGTAQRQAPLTCVVECWRSVS